MTKAKYEAKAKEWFKIAQTAKGEAAKKAMNNGRWYASKAKNASGMVPKVPKAAVKAIMGSKPKVKNLMDQLLALSLEDIKAVTAKAIAEKSAELQKAHELELAEARRIQAEYTDKVKALEAAVVKAAVESPAPAPKKEKAVKAEVMTAVLVSQPAVQPTTK